MLFAVDAVLHRIEALAAAGGYAVTFRRHDGSEQAAVVQLTAEAVQVAEASLPAGWLPDSDMFAALVEALEAVERARRLSPQARLLSDVPGGWDVALGNVVLAGDGVPSCTAHGAMTGSGARYECPSCGARALLG
jgi:hypothetical protein